MSRGHDIHVDFVEGKSRPRFGNGHTYTPAKTRSAEEAIAWQWKAEGHPIYSCPVSVEIFVSAPLPKSLPKRVESRPYTVKPDIDNIAKLALDALNGVAYEDDKQVVALMVRKHQQRRNSRQYTHIRVTPVEE